MTTLATFFTSLALVLALALPVYSNDCVQIIYLKTGDRKEAGTDARVTLNLYDKDGKSVGVSDLQTVGLMDSGHDYFERNNLESFSFRAKCLSSPVCKIELSHDNGGNSPGWYVSYLNVISSSIAEQCISKEFTINQWLALDEPPYSLSLTRNLCISSNVLNNTDVSMPHLNLPSSTV